MAIQAQLYSENLGFGLGLPQDLLVDNNACGFNNFCLIPQQEKLQQQFMEFDQFQNLSHQKQSSFTNHQLIMASYPDISSHIEKQRTEIDRLITLQNEKLRFALQEQRKKQLTMFSKKFESKIQFLFEQKEEEIRRAGNRGMELEDFLKRMEIEKFESKIQFLFEQKEEEIRRAGNRGMELEDFLKRMEIENLTWQRVAKEREAMVESLNGTIERLREAASNAADDAESCCGEEEEEEEEEEKDGNTGEVRGTICRCCNSRDSCVIMLPCRHMCCCKYCEAFLDFCPVCKMVKKASIEALL